MKLLTFKVLVLVTITFSSLAFTSNIYAEISPLSGQWQPTIASHNAKGCPSMMKAILEKAKIDTSIEKVKFSKPFHPSDFFDSKDINPENRSDVKWVNPKPNYWEVEVLNNQEGMQISAQWSLLVTSTSTMDFTSNLLMKFPKELAAMFGGSECKLDSKGSIKRIGD